MKVCIPGGVPVAFVKLRGIDRTFFLNEEMENKRT